ncbi:MAG: hypothetical protein LBK06_03835 [Planctomycetaceae bacterium]|jgi:hypothetical protein|nr:hypothetical protein [Planctomycetaceae bacterium]
MCITGGVAIAQPPEVQHTTYKKPRRGEIIKWWYSAVAIFNPLHISPLRGFGSWGVFSRRLRGATPPVMHISPLAGLFDKIHTDDNIDTMFNRTIFWNDF